MTENQKRLLTEFLGECWHESLETRKCQNCGEVMAICDHIPGDGVDWKHRTFTTWQDLGDVKDKLVENGRLTDFLEWVLNYAYYNKIILSRREHVGVAWCWWESLSALDRCRLVAEYLEGK
jgi:hypothetical protein